MLRGYSTRHGAGPLVTEDNSLAIPHCHNNTNVWQGDFRHGWFDAVSARYALEVVGGVDLLAITNLDRMSALDEIKYATRYQGVDESYFVNECRLKIRREDITTLGERCQVLAECNPEYRSLAGFNTSLSGMLNYLDCLEEELQHPIKAFSRSIACHKDYR